MIAVTLKLPGENMKNDVYQLVKNAIMSLQLQLGQFLSEVELAKLLNTSRIPIREALTKLKRRTLKSICRRKQSIFALFCAIRKVSVKEAFLFCFISN